MQDGSEHDALKLDKDDPLYDESEDTEAYILTSGVTEDVTGYDEVVEKQVYGPMLTLTEFKLQVADIVREYFDSADSDEVIRSLEEMKCRPYLPEVVKKAISLSLDEGPRERELVSRLLTCLHPTPLSDEDMAAGFDLLLTSLDDLCIDCPDAKVCFCRVIDMMTDNVSLSHPVNDSRLLVHGWIVSRSCSRRRGTPSGLSLYPK